MTHFVAQTENKLHGYFCWKLATVHRFQDENVWHEVQQSAFQLFHSLISFHSKMILSFP